MSQPPKDRHCFRSVHKNHSDLRSYTAIAQALFVISMYYLANHIRGQPRKLRNTLPQNSRSCSCTTSKPPTAFCFGHLIGVPASLDKMGADNRKSVRIPNEVMSSWSPWMQTISNFKPAAAQNADQLLVVERAHDRPRNVRAQQLIQVGDLRH